MNLKDLLNSNKLIAGVFYFSIIGLVICSCWLFISIFKVDQLIERIELSTLDLRFRLPIRQLQHSDDILILAIDDNSLEIMEEDLGSWPWARSVHAEVAQGLADAGVESVGFDLMFIGKQKDYENNDRILVETLGRLENIFISMNFDKRAENNPPDIIQEIKKLAVNIEDHSDINYEDLTFTNCRAIFFELLQATDRIGIINHSRDSDSISRRNGVFFRYKGDFYPYLAAKMAFYHYEKLQGKPIKDFVITKDRKLLLADKKVPLDPDGKMILNWYGPSQTFQYVPMWKVIKSIRQKKAGVPPILDIDTFFKGKMVFIGATASSLFDIKTTPYTKVYPGVEVQATFLNNLLDGNFLKKAPPVMNLFVCVILFIITGASVLRFNSGLVTFSMTLSIALIYLLLVAYLFSSHYIWVDIVYPVLVIFITFTLMYVIKYIMKSRDFEYTYKLATTDGLTGLHNHRFFQERMANNIERCKRYGNHFSLVLIDIDFFKKFNDNYGHQAGDAVLKQVAETLKRSVRASDLVARYGGEEMAIVLDNADIEEALIIANKICKTVASKRFRLTEDLEVGVTITLGVSTYPQHGESSTEMIEFADKCLYRGKENGRNQVGPFEGMPTNLIEDETPEQEPNE